MRAGRKIQANSDLSLRGEGLGMVRKFVWRRCSKINHGKRQFYTLQFEYQGKLKKNTLYGIF